MMINSEKNLKVCTLIFFLVFVVLIFELTKMSKNHSKQKIKKLNEWQSDEWMLNLDAECWFQISKEENRKHDNFLKRANKTLPFLFQIHHRQSIRSQNRNLISVLSDELIGDHLHLNMDLRQQDQFSRKCHRFEALEQPMALEENKKVEFSQHLRLLEEDICQVQRPTDLHGFRDTWGGHKRLMSMIRRYRVRVQIYSWHKKPNFVLI